MSTPKTFCLVLGAAAVSSFALFYAFAFLGTVSGIFSQKRFDDFNQGILSIPNDTMTFFSNLKNNGLPQPQPFICQNTRTAGVMYDCLVKETDLGKRLEKIEEQIAFLNTLDLKKNIDTLNALIASLSQLTRGFATPTIPEEQNSE
jgi:hypothetical protein